MPQQLHKQGAALTLKGTPGFLTLARIHFSSGPATQNSLSLRFISEV